MTHHPRTLVVDVTVEDIKIGFSRDCQRCPVAIAAARALGVTTDRILVDTDGVWVDGGKDSYAFYPANEATIGFIHFFDGGYHRDAEPFTTMLTRHNPNASQR